MCSLVPGAADVGGARQAEALDVVWNQPTGGRHVGIASCNWLLGTEVCAPERLSEHDLQYKHYSSITVVGFLRAICLMYTFGTWNVNCSSNREHQ